MLKVLSFSVTVPTVNGFCTELIKEMALSEEVSMLAMVTNSLADLLRLFTCIAKWLEIISFCWSIAYCFNICERSVQDHLNSIITPMF